MAPLARVLRRLAPAWPELRRLRVAIAFADLPEDTLLRYDWSPAGFEISVGDLLRGAPARVLEGGIAHELAHIVRDSRLAPRARERAYDRYSRSHFYRVRDERATDRVAIERGFGPQLLAFLRHARTLRYRFHGEHGLSVREILHAPAPHTSERAAHCRPQP